MRTSRKQLKRSVLSVGPRSLPAWDKNGKLVYPQEVVSGQNVTGKHAECPTVGRTVLDVWDPETM
jgi:hypothetical protein